MAGRAAGVTVKSFFGNPFDDVCGLNALPVLPKQMNV
jgi:hypothetical protein